MKLINPSFSEGVIEIGLHDVFIIVHIPLDKTKEGMII